MAPNSQSSGRHARGYHERTSETREIRQRFLIVCEGVRTEPNYFRAFRLPTLVVDVEGAGDNTIGVVEYAIKANDEGDYDQVWCVFDRDSFPTERFNAAISTAIARGFRVAYSNAAFELWYIFHFEYLVAALHRDDYAGKIAMHIGQPYKKNSMEMYGLLQPYQKVAIRHAAKRLSECVPPSPAHDDPSTTVHLLVQELNRFAV